MSIHLSRPQTDPPGEGGVNSVEEIHLSLLQALPDGMCFVDRQGAVRFWNDAAESISGFSVAEAVCARRMDDVFFLSGSDGKPLDTLTALTAQMGATRCYLRHKDGHAVPVTVRRLPVLAQNESYMGALFLFAMPEDAARAEKPEADTRPAWLRSEPEESPADWLHGEHRPVAILLVQIDGFEALERRLGPEATEKLFALVERTVAHCLRDDETCRRLHGGVVLASLRSSTKLLELAHKLKALVSSARVQWWGEVITITVSIGGTSVGAHDAVADAVRRAEDCVIQAIGAGGDQVVLAQS